MPHTFQSPYTSTLNCCATNVSPGYTHILWFERTITNRFCCHTPSVQFSRIFVNFTAGRRLQLIPAAGPRDHMPLTMDLVTNGTLSGSYARKMGPRENRRNALRSRRKAHFLPGASDKHSKLIDCGLASTEPLLMTDLKTSCR